MEAVDEFIEGAQNQGVDARPCSVKVSQEECRLFRALAAGNEKGSGIRSPSPEKAPRSHSTE